MVNTAIHSGRPAPRSEDMRLHVEAQLAGNVEKTFVIEADYEQLLRALRVRFESLSMLRRAIWQD